uniref:Uncharacterized protein n=1 Tax=Arundo donax TaxID=35708 RepID=A0A0A9GJB0_ARUDO
MPLINGMIQRPNLFFRTTKVGVVSGNISLTTPSFSSMDLYCKTENPE